MAGWFSDGPDTCGWSSRKVRSPLWKNQTTALLLLETLHVSVRPQSFELHFHFCDNKKRCATNETGRSFGLWLSSDFLRFLSPLLPGWRLNVSKCFSGWSWDDAFNSTFVLAPKTHYGAQIYLCLLSQRGLCFAPRCGWKSTSALWSHMKMLLLQPRRMKQALCVQFCF